MLLDERRQLADANAIAAFSLAAERLGATGHGRARFGAAEAVAVGVDVAFFNSVFAFDPAVNAADVLAGIAWVEARGLPASVRISDDADPEIRIAVEALGLVADSFSTPVMVLEPIPKPPPVPDEIVIRTGSVELIEDLHTALESGEVFRRIFGLDFVSDPGVRLAVAYLDGRPVAGAGAIRSRTTVGIYAVATLERARRRGIGRAVTWAAIEAGALAWGASIAILQSTQMGLPVYYSMGFQEVGRYLAFERPPT